LHATAASAITPTIAKSFGRFSVELQRECIEDSFDVKTRRTRDARVNRKQ
jgi:hypothetical protein